MYQNGDFCFNCVAPCVTCTSSTDCKSCDGDYLAGTSCVKPDDCPKGTYPQADEKKCKTCPTGCTECEND